MKIFNRLKEKITFGELTEEQAFKYEGFHYIKTRPFKFYNENKGIRVFNTIAIDPKIDLEYFEGREFVIPINLVGVIDYDNK